MYSEASMMFGKYGLTHEVLRRESEEYEERENNGINRGHFFFAVTLFLN